MRKDYKPGDFNRTCDYKSDLEISETGTMVKSVNTSFGGKNHNAYIMRKDGTHEHFYYNPQSQKRVDSTGITGKLTTTIQIYNQNMEEIYG